MYKTFFTLIVLLSGFAAGFAQKEEENSPKSSVVGGQTVYSASIPYQPRQIDEKKYNQKKEKKSKKDLSAKDKAQFAENALSNNGEIQIIKIPIFISDQKGMPIADLKRSDFKLSIDGIEREILSFEAGEQSLNLLLVLDTNPSTAHQPEEVQNFTVNLIESLKPSDRLQIIKFNAEVTALTEPTNDRQTLKKSVKKIKTGDGTSLYDALQTIFRKYVGSSADEQKTIILLTDGVDTTSLKANYITSLTEAEKSAAAVFPFYLDTLENIGKTVKPTPSSVFFPIIGGQPPLSKEDYELGKFYLTDVAAISGRRIFAVKNLSAVNKKDFESALQLLKPQYYISFNSSGGTENLLKRKQVKVRINRPNLIVRTRGSYIAAEKN